MGYRNPDILRRQKLSVKIISQSKSINWTSEYFMPTSLPNARLLYNNRSYTSIPLIQLNRLTCWEWWSIIGKSYRGCTEHVRKERKHGSDGTRRYFWWLIKNGIWAKNLTPDMHCAGPENVSNTRTSETNPMRTHHVFRVGRAVGTPLIQPRQHVCGIYHPFGTVQIHEIFTTGVRIIFGMYIRRTYFTGCSQNNSMITLLSLCSLVCCNTK